MRGGTRWKRFAVGDGARASPPRPRWASRLAQGALAAVVSASPASQFKVTADRLARRRASPSTARVDTGLHVDQGRQVRRRPRSRSRRSTSATDHQSMCQSVVTPQVPARSGRSSLRARRPAAARRPRSRPRTSTSTSRTSTPTPTFRGHRHRCRREGRQQGSRHQEGRHHQPVRVLAAGRLGHADRCEADGVATTAGTFKLSGLKDVAVQGCQGVLTKPTSADGRGSRWRPRPSTFGRAFTRWPTSPPQQSRTRELFSTSAETPAAAGQFTRRRLQFRAWRGARPFWAGLFVALGAGSPSPTSRTRTSRSGT
ncbi:hypothetical protein STENM327S_00678 [Streptomyces tendae]